MVSSAAGRRVDLSDSAPHSLVTPSNSSGNGIRVGVIDSGWDRTIDDPRVIAGVGAMRARRGGALDWSTDDRDRNGHGTAAVDLILQVARGASIVPIRVFGARLETSPEVLVGAIDWAVHQRLPLVNLSAGTLREDALIPLYQACERARRAGTIVVAAADNRGDGWSFPAVFESAIGVGHAEVPRRHDIIYRPDEALECGACAIEQVARGLGGAPSVLSGTSYAAPIVTGHIARFLEDGIAADLDEIRRQLLASVRRPIKG